MSNIVSPRRSIDVQGGGRGGAGNIESGGAGREYIDGGMYRSETPGADGKPYSTGRGGAGNMGEGSSRASTSESDRPVDEYPNESVVSHREGETGSGGRGGAGNIGEIQSQDKVAANGKHSSPLSQEPMHGEESEEVCGKERNPRLEKRRLSSGMSHLGLADKLKFGILSMVKKD